jgi:hypothetical protein
MAWDSSRPVPWRRMVNEWLIYVGVMFIVILIAFRDQPVIGLVAGLLVSGPLYLGFGYVLAKFGYRRKSYRELRHQGGRPATDADDDVAPPPRAKPAPTSRTGGASGRPGGKRKRR